MEKAVSCISGRLIVVCLLIAGCAGLFWGCTSTKQAMKPIVSAAEVAEVQDVGYEPRRNPAAGRASSDVYALPALALKPEEERLPTPVYAISGVRGQEIREGSPWEVVDILVDFPATGRESFSRGIIEGTDVSDWIINLPAGLEGRAHRVRRGARSIRIYVSGTPTVTMRELIRVRIPGTYLTGGRDRDFVSPTETESLRVWEATQTAAE
jgi:hypothetical protein